MDDYKIMLFISSALDVSTKNVTQRAATARSTVQLPPNLVTLFAHNEYQSKKGPVVATAIIAGTMAAKSTSQLIPFCHPLSISSCKFGVWMQPEVSLAGGSAELVIECEVKVSGVTGVEMEALVGASVAALTVYDMCKAVSHDIVIKDTRLIKKTGGKSDIVEAPRPTVYDS